jgi:paraquat-inducible protein A
MLVHRLPIAFLVVAALALSLRVIDHSTAAANYLRGYCLLRAPGQQFDTMFGFLAEGFSLGILPVGSDKEIATQAIWSSWCCHESAAVSLSWTVAAALGLAIVWSTLPALLSRRLNTHLIHSLLAVSVVCLVVGVTAPIMSMTSEREVPVVGPSIVHHTSHSILSTVQELFGTDKRLIGFLILLFSVLTPLAKLGLTLTATQSVSPGVRAPAMRIVTAIGKWSMADVVVVAVLLAILSLRSAPGEASGTHTGVGIGFYFFLSYCVISLLTGQLAAARQLGVSAEPDVGSSVATPLRAGLAAALLGLAALGGVLAASSLRVSTAVRDTFVVAPGTMCSCSVLASEASGVLTASWRSSGAEHFGNDDTIVSATLRDPKGHTLRYWDHAAMGSFSERVQHPGAYSLVFSNVGIIRSTGRTVTVDLACR